MTQTIYVAGHRGMVGSAIVRQLENQADCNIITRTHADLDLTNQVSVANFFLIMQLIKFTLPPPR